jgi:hypothetical protein
MLGRIIIVAAAAFLGVLVVLTSMTTVRPVPVNPDMPVFKRTDTRESEFPSSGLPTMSEERRRQRASELVDEPLKYVRSGRLLHPTWIKQEGIKGLERMMDECYLLADETLFARHLKAIADMDPSEVDPEPDHFTKSQMRSCDNVAKVYAETRK